MPNITIALSTDTAESHFYLPTGWYTISQKSDHRTGTDAEVIDGWLCPKCGKSSWLRRKWCYYCAEPRPATTAAGALNTAKKPDETQTCTEEHTHGPAALAASSTE